jgi:hypothetical protein
VWHQRVFKPAVFHALVAWVEVYIALAPNGGMRRVLLVLVRLALARLMALLRQPLLPMVPPRPGKTIVFFRVPVMLPLYSRHRFSPAAPEVLEMFRVVRVAAVLLVLPMARVVSWILLFVLHACYLKLNGQKKIPEGPGVYKCTA